MGETTKEVIVAGESSVPNDVKKSNQLIHSKFKLTTLQQNILFLALAKAKRDKQDNVIRAEVNMLEVKKYTGTKGHSIYARAEKAAVNLATLYILNRTGEDEFHVQSGIIDDVKYKNGTLFFEFGKKYEPLIYDLKSNFTSINTLTYMRLSTGYCKRLYEILKSETFKGDIIIKEMSIGEIKLSLGMVDINETMQYELQRNSHLNTTELVAKYADKDITWTYLRMTIEKIIDEINEKTDIHVTHKLVKVGRGGKIVGVEFTVTKRKDTEELEKKEDVIKEPDEDELDELIDEVKEIIEEKIKTKDCKTLLKIAGYSVGKIKEKYEIMKMKETPVKDMVAWLICAIKDDYQKPIIVEGKEKKNNFNSFNQSKYSERFYELLSIQAVRELTEEEKKEYDNEIKNAR